MLQLLLARFGASVPLQSPSVASSVAASAMASASAPWTHALDVVAVSHPVQRDDDEDADQEQNEDVLEGGLRCLGDTSAEYEKCGKRFVQMEFEASIGELEYLFFVLVSIFISHMCPFLFIFHTNPYISSRYV